jgi:carbamoyl-phosphate synthase small subunit
MRDLQEAYLVLENGVTFHGYAQGDLSQFEETQLGEVVFNTSMTGYQEVFSDPSYCDQIICMTYPLIGNYGVTQHDYENLSPHLKGIVIKEFSRVPSNWRSEKSINDFCLEHHIPALVGVDTRALTKEIRKHGAMKGVFTLSKEKVHKLNEKLRTDQIPRVSSKNPTHFPGNGPRVVLLDFGYKKKYSHFSFIPRF